MQTVYTDRSRIETYQRCPRLRWLEYHESGTGIVPAKKALALCVGGSVHKGLEVLLRAAINAEPLREFGNKIMLPLENDAVAAALADFSTHRSALALDLTESTALTAALDPSDAGFNAQLTATAQELGMSPDDPSLAELLRRQRNSAAEFDDWLWKEQAALVEGMVRAYARRRLRPLLEEFEVLEVEREEQWTLAEGSGMLDRSALYEYLAERLEPKSRIDFLSRPDALLRSRADNSLYILSFKTAASWDVRKERDAQHDMQGLSEGVGVEKRLARWWATVQNNRHFYDNGDNARMADWLADLPAPPRILGIRYEYMLKGSRYADKDLAARFGLNVWAQRSLLVRAYHNDATDEWCHAYEFLKDDGSASKLYWKTWRPKAVWEHMPVRQWIDMLDSATVSMSAYDSTVGQEPRPLGWKSAAQAQGYTPTHPLDDIFPSPLTVYRSDDDLRDWIEQVEGQERRVAEGVAQINAANDEGEKRHLLNVLAPMARRSCSYPTECAFTKVCYGGEDIRRSPLESGLFKRREPNHPAEGMGIAMGKGKG